jgi:hypothetical protein
MNTMTPTHPAGLQSCRSRLATGPAAVREARSQVRAAIGAHDIPVDPQTAVLLASELVTSAVRHEAGQSVMLVISWSGEQLRVDVHDTSPVLPALADPAAGQEAGWGLQLVAALAAEWGFSCTPAGKAVYFTLAFRPGGRLRGRRARPPGTSRAGAAGRDPARRLAPPVPRSLVSLGAIGSTR